MLYQDNRGSFGVFASAPDGVERRDAERQRTRLSAYVTFPNGTEQRDCQILDISPKGARLRLADSSTLPKFFELHTPTGDAYLCEVKRRKAAYVGVEFLQSS